MILRIGPTRRGSVRGVPLLQLAAPSVLSQVRRSKLPLKCIPGRGLASERSPFRLVPGAVTGAVSGAVGSVGVTIAVAAAVSIGTGAAIGAISGGIKAAIDNRSISEGARNGAIGGAAGGAVGTAAGALLKQAVGAVVAGEAGTVIKAGSTAVSSTLGKVANSLLVQPSMPKPKTCPAGQHGCI